LVLIPVLVIIFQQFELVLKNLQLFNHFVFGPCLAHKLLRYTFHFRWIYFIIRYEIIKQLLFNINKLHLNIANPIHKLLNIHTLLLMLFHLHLIQHLSNKSIQPIHFSTIFSNISISSLLFDLFLQLLFIFYQLDSLYLLIVLSILLFTINILQQLLLLFFLVLIVILHILINQLIDLFLLSYSFPIFFKLAQTDLLFLLFLVLFLLIILFYKLVQIIPDIIFWSLHSV